MRILLADVQPKVRFALRVLLERQAEMEVLGEATDFPNLVTLAEAMQPDLMLVGWELLQGEARDRLSMVRNCCPHCIVISLSGRPETRPAALRAGVDAFASKADPPERLLEAIRSSVAKPRLSLTQ